MGALFVASCWRPDHDECALLTPQDFIKGLVLVIALVFTFSLSARKAGSISKTNGLTEEKA